MTGRTIGHYEILEKLGTGGMGVVWKARDHVLDRLVAIKVLPEARVEDAQRRQRFVQEAKAASALNHPNIVTIYEAGSEAGQDYLVMEFIKGRTLAELIQRGPLKTGEVLRLASQMAAALAAAHAAHIVHRDIKPGNIMVTETGLVKVLDFGLAKLAEAPPAPDGDSTVTVLAPTDAGTVMGTAAYMSPEQADGKPVDARTDVFSFGAVLYELLTGERAFHGETKLSTMSAVVEKDPAPLGAGIPLPVERMVMRCLRKDPARRWQNMADLQMSLEELRDDTDSGRLSPVAGKREPRRSWLVYSSVIVLLAAGGLVWNRTRPGPPVATPTVTSLTTYPGSEVQPCFSPDGNHIAFSWDGESQDNYDIWVKRIGPGEPLRLTSDPAIDSYPAWSPDGNWIAFLRSMEPPGALRGEAPETPARFSILVVPALGGAERKIGESAGLGLAWTGEGRWLITTDSASRELVLVSFETGERRNLTTGTQRPFQARSGAISPDGRTLAFARATANSSGLFTAKLTGTIPRIEGEPKPLLPPAFINLSPAWIADGQELVFSRGQPDSGMLFRVKAGSSASPELLGFAGDGAAWPAVSPRGKRMVFSRSLRDVNLWALDLNERGQAVGDPKAVFVSSKSERCARFSPDGRRIAFESNRGGTDEIWVCLQDGSNCQPITSTGGPHVGTPAWSPDGEWIAFDGNLDGRTAIYVISAQGGKARYLTPGSVPRWSADGKWIYYSRGGIFRIPPSGGEPAAVTRRAGASSEESPDGRFIYFSGSPNWTRTFLRRVPAAGGEEQEVLAEISGRNFVPVESGVWYLTPNSREGCRLEFLDFATRTARIVSRIPRPASAGLTLSPDRRRIVWAQVDREGSDLMLVENFH